MDSEKSKTGLVMKYFVLKPKGDNPYAKASREAMQAYANAIEGENPQLASELHSWVGKERPPALRKAGSTMWEHLH